MDPYSYDKSRYAGDLDRLAGAGTAERPQLLLQLFRRVAADADAGVLSARAAGYFLFGLRAYGDGAGRLEDATHLFHLAGRLELPENHAGKTRDALWRELMQEIERLQVGWDTADR